MLSWPTSNRVLQGPVFFFFFGMGFGSGFFIATGFFAIGFAGALTSFLTGLTIFLRLLSFWVLV
jgi:hypothetical protein